LTVGGWVPPQLQPLVGLQLADIGPQTVQRLIGVAEASHLEFKREMYGRGDGQAKEACYDVAALANGSGGLLAIGVDEDGSGMASELTPLDPSIDVALWVHQVLAARVAPAVELQHHAVDVDGGRVHLLSVPPSDRRPHVVDAGGGAMRVPVRSGTTRRFMSEAELADAFYQRFGRAQSTIARLDALQERSSQRIEDRADSEDWVWLCLAAAPLAPSTFPIDLRRGRSDEWLDWVDPAVRLFPAFGPRCAVSASVGFRAIEISDAQGAIPDFYGFDAILDVDGAGSLVFGYPGGHGSRGIEEGTAAVFDEYLIGDVLNGTMVLGTHAQRCGARGDLGLSAFLTSEMPMALAEYRSKFPGPLAGTRTVAGPTPKGARTAHLDDAIIPSPALVNVARLVLTDLISNFGLPQPQQITVDNELVRNRFNRDWHDPMETWAAAASVTVVDSY